MATILVEILGSAKQFKAELAGAEAATGRASGSFAKFGAIAGTAALAVGAGAAFVAVKSVEAATAFQSSMELIQTQAGGSAKEVHRMSDALVKMATSVGQTPEELSKGLYHVESAGFRGAKALQILRLAAEGAAVGHADLEQTTTALVAAQRSGIAGLGNMSHAMGSLNAIVGAGNMRMDDLTAALGTGILPVAKVFGLTISDVGGALATMTSNGIPAVNAASGLKMMFASLAAPTHAAKKALDSIGLSSTDLADTMRNKGLGAALVELKTHMQDTGLNATQSAALLTTAFGKKSSTGLLTLLGNLKDVKSATDQIKTGAKDFGSKWEETQKTAEFASKKFHAAVSALEIQIGASLLPTVTRFTNWLTSQLPGAIATAKRVIEAIKPTFMEIKTVIEDIGKKFGELGGYVGTAVDAFMGMKGHSEAIQAALIVVGTAIANVTLAMLAMNLAFLANPVVLIVLALAALAAGLVLAYKNSETFRSIVNAVFSSVKAAFDATLGWIKNTGIPDFMRVWDAVEPVVVGVAKAVIGAVRGIVSGIQENWGTIKEIIVPPIEAAWAQVKLTFNTAKTVIVNLIDGFKNVIEGHWGKAWENFKNIAGALLGQVKGTIVNSLGDVSHLLYRAGVAIADSLYNGIKDGLKKVYDLAGSVAGKIASLKGPIEADRVLLVPHGQAIIEGLLLGLNNGLSSLPGTLSAGVQKALTAARAVIQTAQASFQTAWSALAPDANSALAGSQSHMTKAGKELAGLQASHDAAGRQAALDTANSEYDTARAGGDPAAILAARKQVDEALYQMSVADLQKESAAQQIELDARNALQGRHFDAAMTKLQAHLAKGHASYSEAHAAILKLFKSFGINYAEAGAALGTDFIKGLKETIQGAAKQSGSLSGKLESVAAGIHIPHAATGGFVAQTGLAVIHQGETITPAGQGGGVNVYITGMIGDDQVEQLRNILIRKGRNTTGGALGSFA